MFNPEAGFKYLKESVSKTVDRYFSILVVFYSHRHIFQTLLFFIIFRTSVDEYNFIDVWTKSMDITQLSSQTPFDPQTEQSNQEEEILHHASNFFLRYSQLHWKFIHHKNLFPFATDISNVFKNEFKSAQLNKCVSFFQLRLARLEDPAATLACTKSILVTTHGSKKEGKAFSLLQDLLMEGDDT
jgi:hypothetical protein